MENHTVTSQLKMQLIVGKCFGQLDRIFWKLSMLQSCICMPQNGLMTSHL